MAVRGCWKVFKGLEVVSVFRWVADYGCCNRWLDLRWWVVWLIRFGALAVGLMEGCCLVGTEQQGWDLSCWQQPQDFNFSVHSAAQYTGLKRVQVINGIVKNKK